MSTTPPSSVPSGQESVLLSWFDKIVDAMPHDGARQALHSARGAVESVVQQGSELGATQAAEAQRALQGLRGITGEVKSPLLCNVAQPGLLVLPGIAAAVGVNLYLRSQKLPSVPSEQAGPGVATPPLVERLKTFVLHAAPITTSHHGVQMILHGAAVCLTAYVLKFVLPVNQGGKNDLTAEPAFTATVRSAVNGLRVVCGLPGGKSLPAAMHRIAHGALRSQLVTLLRLALASYGLHAVVVLHGERAKTPLSLNIVRAAHIGSTALDLATAIWAPFASSLPPLGKLISTGLLCSLGRVVYPASGALHNFTDPLRAVLMTTSLVKALAVLCSTSFGVPTGSTALVRAACMGLAVPTWNATMLPTTSRPLQPRVTLPLLAAAHVVTDCATLALFAQLKRGSAMPVVTLPGVRSPFALAQAAAVIDLVALLGVAAYQYQAGSIPALQDRVVQIAIPEAMYAAPPPTVAVPPQEVQEWAKEFDFASQANMDSPQQHE